MNAHIVAMVSPEGTMCQSQPALLKTKYSVAQYSNEFGDSSSFLVCTSL